MLKAVTSRVQDFIFQVPAGPSLAFVYFTASAFLYPCLFRSGESPFFFDYKLYEKIIFLGVGTAPGTTEVSIVDKIQL